MHRRMGMLLVFLAVLLLSPLVAQASAALFQSGPALEYLGEGGSYTIADGRHFIVKQTGPFRFINVPGPTYTATGDERVWAATLNAPSPLVRTWVSYGSVPKGCEISYMAIDDDPDDRINVFYIDDDPVHDMPQGFVTGGSFVSPSAGNLRLQAVDSIGIWLDKCEGESTITPTTPPVDTITATPTATATTDVTVSPTATTPVTVSPTATDQGPSTAIAPTPEQETATPTATATKKPRLPACLRINFEVSGDLAKEGVFEVRETGGRLLYSWYAEEGWYDSGWIRDIDISFESVFIEVFYVPADGPRVRMEIFNPAPGTSYGWLGRGMCHALEVGWPDETITPTPTPDAQDGFNDEFDLEQLDLLRFIWPGIQPTATSTPASSLRG
ncbi:MAG: hypothetical protein ACK2UK_07295 [Candidatus Promineifilaceae bacterium]